MKRLRRYIIAGILVWLPIGVTIFLVRILIGLLDRTLVLIPQKYQPEELLGFAIPGLGILLTIIILLVTGVLAANIVGAQHGWIVGVDARANSCGPLGLFGSQKLC